ncbi:MAG TPA: hypothetical protein VHP63_07155 [candidate division Zixibacteria bacterium]|nr:hypothetical protein [candidate division Zixibacteria bacterium]
MSDRTDSERLETRNHPERIESMEVEEEPKYRADMLEGIQLLDSLITEFHDRIKTKIDKYFKTGDFIKMIELRYKLAPTNDDQKKFWAMLAKIRRDTLQKEENANKSEAQKPTRNVHK